MGYHDRETEQSGISSPSIWRARTETQVGPLRRFQSLRAMDDPQPLMSETQEQ